jgi:protein SCO1/2
MRARLAIVPLALLALTGEASARLTPAEYRAIGVTVPENAALPFAAVVADEAGRHHALGDFVARPTVLLFADYTCRTLCGPALAFVADALEQSGLRPGAQFRLLVIGLDGRGTAADTERLRREHLQGRAPEPAAVFLRADAATSATLTRALGYHYLYDAEADQDIHPAAAFVLTGDGKVSRVLTGLGLSAADLRLALVEAGQGRIGSFGDQVRLLCSTFDPRHGTYTLAISRLLAGASGVTVVLLAGCIGLLWRADRRAVRGAALDQGACQLPGEQ